MKTQNAPAIMFTPQAFDLLRRHMDEGGRLTASVRLSLACVRATWMADARGHVGLDDVVLPKGCDIDAITEMLAWTAQVRCEDSRISGWRMPPLSTAYLCDDGKVRTIGQMLEGISIELMPHDEMDFEALLFCYGVDWTHPLVPTMQPYGFLA